MTISEKIKIAYFGKYDPNYTRVRTVLKGLKKNNIAVYECLSNDSFYLKRIISLISQYLKITEKIDILMVSEAGQAYVFPAKILSLLTKKPLLFDAFLSYYHVKVIDTKEISRYSLKGKYFYYLDKLSCKLADIALLDTEEHIDYFCKTFNLNRRKFKSLPVGSDEEIFYPFQKISKEKSEFLIFLVSSFYPLHGVEYVIKASKLLEKYKDIKFLIIGDGPTKKNIEKLIEDLHIKNVELKGIQSPLEVAKLMAKSDICMGQFGATNQAQMVIPAKVYDAIAMAKPVITGDSIAVKKIFAHNENIILCPVADSIALAKSIIFLKENHQLREKIAKNGYQLFLDNFCLLKIGEKLILIIKDLLKKYD